MKKIFIIFILFFSFLNFSFANDKKICSKESKTVKKNLNDIYIDSWIICIYWEKFKIDNNNKILEKDFEKINLYDFRYKNSLYYFNYTNTIFLKDFSYLWNLKNWDIKKENYSIFLKVKNKTFYKNQELDYDYDSKKTIEENIFYDKDNFYINWIKNNLYFDYETIENYYPRNTEGYFLKDKNNTYKIDFEKNTIKKLNIFEKIKLKININIDYYDFKYLWF